MTTLNRAQIVKTALPHRIRRPGSDWRACDASIEDAIDTVLRVLLGANPSPDLRWFKHTDKKWIFRIDGGHVAKVMYLATLMLRLKYRRYARDEAGNLIWAASQGVRVPPVHAVGAIRTRTGLVGSAVLIVGELGGMRTVTELLREADGEPDRIANVLRATLPAFERLFRCGCNHIDLNAGNIMLDPADLQAMPAVIDFKYALFHRRPSLEILMLEAARFGADCATMVPDAAVQEWFESLLAAVAVENAGQREWCRKRFHGYLNRRMSRKDRQRAEPFPSREAEHDRYASV